MNDNYTNLNKQAQQPYYQQQYQPYSQENQMPQQPYVQNNQNIQYGQPAYQAPNQYQQQQQWQSAQYQQPNQQYQDQPDSKIYLGANQNDNSQELYVQNLPGDNLFFERKGFIVKVYTLLSFQLMITFGLVIIAYLSEGFRNILVYQNSSNLTPLSWICFAISIITEIAIFCCKSVAKKVPNNYIALTLFTVTFGIVIAALCGSVYNAFSNGAILVVISALMTFAVTLSLTLYACTTKTDFTMCGGALWIISVVLLIVFIFSFFFFSVFWQILVCALVIICYGFYLIYDTQLIMGGKYKQHELSIDDYVIATMLIYIDIIVLFLRILQILLILFGKK